MSGWPGRPSRAAFGPTRANDGVVTDPTKFVSAADYNLTFWQVAGISAGFAARAWALLKWDGAALTLQASGETWDPNGLVLPAVSRTGAGVYLVTYAATSPDMDGAAIATGLIAGRAAAQSLANITAVAVPRANGYEVDVQLFTANTGAAVDATVLVEVG